MPMRDERKFIHVVDGEDRIIAVNPAWSEFADENASPALAAAVIGRPLWEHICDSDTLHLYQVLLERARKGTRPARVPFRCDSPALRRFMVMELVLQEDGLVRFTSWVDRQEARPFMALLDPAQARDEALLKMCGWCKKIESADDEWLEVETAVARLGLFDAVTVPRLTHTMCQACYARLYEDDAGEPS
ncbi:MAG: hypothetical protein AABZ84_03345 [Pseudomonadota bacterium]